MPDTLRRRRGAPKWLRRVDLMLRPSRVDILRFLVEAGPSGATTTEVAASIKAHSTTALRFLTEMEDVGLVVGIPAPDDRKAGKTTRWRISRARVRVALEDLARYIFGDDGTGSDAKTSPVTRSPKRD